VSAIYNTTIKRYCNFRDDKTQTQSVYFCLERDANLANVIAHASRARACRVRKRIFHVAERETLVDVRLDTTRVDKIPELVQSRQSVLFEINASVVVDLRDSRLGVSRHTRGLLRLALEALAVGHHEVYATGADLWHGLVSSAVGAVVVIHNVNAVVWKRVKNVNHLLSVCVCVCVCVRVCVCVCDRASEGEECERRVICGLGERVNDADTLHGSGDRLRSEWRQ
jgi:hypothetical protein